MCHHSPQLEARARRIRKEEVVSWKMRHLQRFYSRCLARGQYSIDQSERLRETVLAQADLAVRGRVHRRVDTPAQVAQLCVPGHPLADPRLAPPEAEVAG